MPSPASLPHLLCFIHSASLFNPLLFQLIGSHPLFPILFHYMPSIFQTRLLPSPYSHIATLHPQFKLNPHHFLWLLTPSLLPPHVVFPPTVSLFLFYSSSSVFSIWDVISFQLSSLSLLRSPPSSSPTTFMSSLFVFSFWYRKGDDKNCMFAQFIAVWLSEKYQDSNKLRDWSVTGQQPVPSSTPPPTTSLSLPLSLSLSLVLACKKSWLNPSAKQPPAGCHELQDIVAQEKCEASFLNTLHPCLFTCTTS